MLKNIIKIALPFIPIYLFSQLAFAQVKKFEYLGTAYDKYELPFIKKTLKVWSTNATGDAHNNREDDVILATSETLDNGLFSVSGERADSDTTHYITIDNYVMFDSTKTSHLITPPSEENTNKLLGKIYAKKENVIPVELSSFQYINNELEWITISETSNYGFEIEQSRDGVNFEIIGFVNGNKTTDKTTEYEFELPDKLKPGDYYYRLKQIDFDGSFEYSPIIMVSVSVPGKFELHQNYPNPFNLETTIKYSLPEDTNVKLTVYNLLGQEIETLVNKFQKAGIHEVKFNADLHSGMYFYNLQTKEFNSTKKMSLMK